MIPAAERSPTIMVLEVPSVMALTPERRALLREVLVDRTLLLRCFVSLAIA